jgi:tRNA(Ile)-lysidine synthase
MSFSAASLHAVLETCIPADVRGLVVALSGGPDSAAMLAALCAPGGSFRDLPLRAVHIDHGLQSAAAEFRRNALALCDELQVPLEVIAVEVRPNAGDSLEAAARDARYAALSAQLEPHECLLTAHHREDQAETFLLQALRGAGLKGMSAMPLCRRLGRGWHARPLLEVSGSDLRRLGQDVRQFQSRDPMNDDTRFDRVHLRKEIWPPIEKRWPGAAAALSRAAAHMAEAQSLLTDRARDDLAHLRDGDELSVHGLRVLPAERRINAVRLWLWEKDLDPPPAARLTEALRQILEADDDQQPSIVWGDRVLRRYRQRMFVTEVAPPRIEAVPWPAKLGSVVELGPGLGRLMWVMHPGGGIAAERLPSCVSVRRREGGEMLKPSASARTQSLQHLCQAFGVLPWMRDALPLIFAGDELVAVADLWVDARWWATGASGFAIAWQGGPFVT